MKFHFFHIDFGAVPAPGPRLRRFSCCRASLQSIAASQQVLNAPGFAQCLNLGSTPFPLSVIAGLERTGLRPVLGPRLLPLFSSALTESFQIKEKFSNKTKNVLDV